MIKSISGIRGTIGGNSGDNLTPQDVVKFTAAFGSWVLEQKSGRRIVIGRDGRISGPMIQQLVTSTLTGLGLDVLDIGLSTTPTVELAVAWEKAAGGIIITASHNPKEWNALKLLTSTGDFLSAADGARVLEIASREQVNFAAVDKLGTYTTNDTYLQKHIDTIVNYPLVNAEGIKAKGYKVVVDVINSTGALCVPQLLFALGVKEVVVLNGEVNGKFAHNPEPLPENLGALSNAVREHKADLGIAVDPDVDRLSFVCEDGSKLGEE